MFLLDVRMHIFCYIVVPRVHMVGDLCFNRLEMEDMEMRHNSSLKQLMREFNTQMALKEKELEGSVKETIGKRGKSTIYCSCYHGNTVFSGHYCDRNNTMAFFKEPCGKMQISCYMNMVI